MGSRSAHSILIFHLVFYLAFCSPGNLFSGLVVGLKLFLRLFPWTVWTGCSINTPTLGAPYLEVGKPPLQRGLAPRSPVLPIVLSPSSPHPFFFPSPFPPPALPFPYSSPFSTTLFPPCLPFAPRTEPLQVRHGGPF